MRNPLRKTKIITDEKRINELLERSVVEVIHKDTLKKELLSGRQLRIKLGIDPTSPAIHLGRAVQLLKLKDFQELGHKIVLIIGDFTGVIGDTSDKESDRPMLAAQKIKENMKGYFAQAGKILDMSAVEKCYNSKWLGKLGYGEIGEHADEFSVSDFIARENIAKRLKAGTRVSLREVLYPLMQGYDSVAVKADVEIGGTDQKFNLLAGRRLQERFGQKPQSIIMNELVAGLDGRKMSSSWGNTINLTDTPFDTYGKVMSLSDALVGAYFIHCTRVPLADVNQLIEDVQSGVLHPRDAKAQLAFEIVKLYHGESEAYTSAKDFESTFKKGGVPEETETVEVNRGAILANILLEKTLVKSKSEFRRLVEENAVSVVEGATITDPEYKVESDCVVKIGKRRFLRIKVK